MYKRQDRIRTLKDPLSVNVASQMSHVACAHPSAYQGVRIAAPPPSPKGRLVPRPFCLPLRRRPAQFELIVFFVFRWPSIKTNETLFADLFGISETAGIKANPLPLPNQVSGRADLHPRANSCTHAPGTGCAPPVRDLATTQGSSQTQTKKILE